MNISGKKKQLFDQAKKFGIWSLFVSIKFDKDQIVHDRLNFAVT